MQTYNMSDVPHDTFISPIPLSPQEGRTYTLCARCVFKTVKTVDGKTYQDGCKLKCDKYLKQQGIPVTYRLSGDIDNPSDLDFYQIGCICRNFRDEQWTNGKGSLYEQRAVVLEENAIAVDIIIASEDIEKIETSLKSIKKQSHKTNKVYVVAEKINAGSIINLFHKYLDNTNIKWEYINYISNSDEGISSTVAINEAAKKSKASYYMFIRGGFKVPKNFLSHLNYKVNCEMWRVLLVKPIDDEMNCMVVHCGAHSFVGGFGKFNLIDKLTDRATEESCQHLIRTHQQVIE